MSLRIVVVGGPRSGKSTYARRWRSSGVPTLCGDPLSTVKEPEDGVEYLPEGIPFAGDDGAAAWIVAHWFPRPGPWVAEGHVMARALRRAADRRVCDRVVVFDVPHPQAMVTPRQLSMGKGVQTVWETVRREIERQGVEVVTVRHE